MSYGVSEAGQVRSEMYVRSDRFFRAVRLLTSGVAKVCEMTADNASRRPLIDMQAVFEQEALPGAHWVVNIPEALADRAKVRVLLEGDASTAVDYLPGSLLRVTTLRASLSTSDRKPSFLYFLERPWEDGRRNLLQFSVDGPAALAAATWEIHPQAIVETSKIEG